MGSTVVRIDPGAPPTQTLALVAGIAVYEALLPYCPDRQSLKLKWPNDIYYRDAKLAGILLEREKDNVIVGVGANLAAAPHLPDRATIALASVGPTPDRDIFAHALMQSFDQELERWRTYGTEPLIRRWESIAHAKGTSLVVHEQTGGLIKGTFDGLLADGSLHLRLADGTTRAIHAGDVLLA